MELFETWENLREIQADNPPTTLALHRFLLSILHRAYNGPRSVEHWEEIQADNGKQAIAYLTKWRDRFDLQHLIHPFMQDISLTREVAGEVYLAAALHGNNTSTVFCHEHQWSGASLSIPEVARLLLRLQMFDVGGRKTGSATSAAVIPTMNAANVLVQGQNLCETLLFNLMEYDPLREVPSSVKGEDIPAWEQKSTKPKERIPSGYIDYLTYQWRRVRLFFEGDRVDRIAVHAGDRLPKELSASQWECGIAYAKTKKGVFTIRLNLQRALWRDSAAFLQSAETSECPRIMNWVAKLKSENLMSGNLHLQIIGLTVDNAKPLGWAREQFSAPAVYLTERPLWEALKRALTIAEKHQEVFRSFRGSPYSALAEALNNHDTGGIAKTLDGESRYWANLDREFQILLEALSADKTVDGNGTTYGSKELPKWTTTVQKVARDGFTESIKPIRNYQARAMALRSLDSMLRKLCGEETETSGKAKKRQKAA